MGKLAHKIHEFIWSISQPEGHHQGLNMTISGLENSLRDIHSLKFNL